MRLIVVFLVLVLVAGMFYAYEPYNPPSNHDTNKHMVVTVNVSCDEIVINVTDEDKGTPVKDAYIVVRNSATGMPVVYRYTDAQGLASFKDCGEKVDIKITHEDYPQKLEVETLPSCEECFRCTSNDDCLSAEYCSDGECLPVQCECGNIEQHSCSEYACCYDSDCKENEQCVNHVCVGRPQPEQPGGCGRNEDCLDTEYCNIPVGAARGSCEEVTGCGSVSNHTLTAYQCGDDPNCRPCPAGYACVQNICKQDSIDCPPTTAVGAAMNCNTTSGDGPCVNCDYVVTDSSGNETEGKSDENGTIRLVFAKEGPYNVSLVRNGSVAKTIGVSAFAPKGEEGKPGTAMFDSLLVPAGILLLIVLIVLLALYFMKRPGSGKRASRAS